MTGSVVDLPLAAVVVAVLTAGVLLLFGLAFAMRDRPVTSKGRR